LLAERKTDERGPRPRRFVKGHTCEIAGHHSSFSTQQLENWGSGHSCKLGVQVCEGGLQEFAVARVSGGLQLLEHMLAGQQQALPLALVGKLAGSERWLRWARS